MTSLPNFKHGLFIFSYYFLAFKPSRKQYFLSHKLDFGQLSPEKISPNEKDKHKYTFGVPLIAEKSLSPELMSTKEHTY